MVLLGNKIDDERNRQVSTEEGEAFAKNNGILFFETCSYAGTNVEMAFYQAVRAAYVMQGVQASENTDRTIKFSSKVIVDNSIQNTKSCKC